MRAVRNDLFPSKLQPQRSAESLVEAEGSFKGKLLESINM